MRENVSLDAPIKVPDIYHHLSHDDEIDLFELGKKLWARRLMILAIAGVVTLIAVAVAFSLPPVWQARIIVYQGSQANLAPVHSLNQILLSEDGSGDIKNISDITPEQAFQLYYRYLSSSATLRSVFIESGLSEQAVDEDDKAAPSEHMSHMSLASVARAFDQFKRDLSIQLSDEASYDVDSITIKYESEDRQFSADLINNYLLPISNAKALAEIKSNIDSDIEREKKRISYQIADIENEFIEKNSSEKTKLRNAIEQAESGGIHSFSAPSVVNIDDLNRFVIGSKILSKQLEQVSMELEMYRFLSRPADNGKDRALLPGVVSLHDKLQRLNQYAVNVDNVKLTTVDEPALVPVLPVRPQKGLIVTLGVVIGGLLGIFTALVQIAISNRKERMPSS